MTKRRLTCALLILTACAVAGCGLLRGKGATDTPAPATAPAPALPTVDLAAIRAEAGATAVAQFIVELTATAQAQPTRAPTRPPTAPPQQPTALPTETATTTPEVSPTPAMAVALKFANITYEQWGRPTKDGCKSFNDKSPVRKFNIQITLNNTSTETITAWFPIFVASTGRQLDTCYYEYSADQGLPAVPAGEARTVTFSTFCEPNEYVSDLTMQVQGRDYGRYCFSPQGALTECR